MILGYTSGVFDLFHIGHLTLLNNAKSLCDKLVVGVSTDSLVENYKNKRTIIPFEERFEIIKNVKSVDAAVSQDTMDKFQMWGKIKFDIMFVGDDWYQTEKWNAIESQLKEVGVRIIYFPYTKGTSSTMINEILNEKRKDLQSK